jgi:putative transposase
MSTNPRRHNSWSQRRAHFWNPTGLDTRQARNLTVTDAPQDKLRFLLRDRDTKYSGRFDAVFQAKDTNILTGAPQAPKMNAIMERWIRTCRTELLDRILILGQTHLLHALREHETFYNQHRPHRALHAAAPQRPRPDPITDSDAIEHLSIRRRDRLGGALREYHHAA